jgi:ligand-binding sensor domain-containing protein
MNPLLTRIRNSMAILLLACITVACEDESARDALDPGTLGRWITYNAGSGLGDNFIWNIYEDSQGNIWTGTNDAGVRTFNGTNWSGYTTNSGMLSNTVYAVVQDADGDMWFGTGGGLNFLIDGLVYYNENFLDVPITALYEDSHRRMWMGTYGAGIYMYFNGSFYEAYFAGRKEYNYINSITEDKSGLIWFGTEGAAIDFDGNDFFIVDSTYGLHNQDITFILEDSWDQLWFCSFHNKFISRYDGKNFEEIYLYHGYNIAGTLSMAEDLDHNLWFVTAAGGIIKYNGIEMIPVKTPLSHQDESFSCSLADRNGNLWFGGLKHGILVYINE